MADRSMLRGTLVDIRPRTLLHFLGLTSKNGVLRAQGHEHDVAVRLENGRVVPDGGDVVSAVVQLLRIANGEFSFEETAGGTDAGGRSMVDVLAEADDVVAEWEDVSQAVPSVGLVVGLRSSKGEQEDVEVSSDAWNVVVEVANGHTTPDALARRLEWSLLRTCRAVQELAERGRVELLPPAQAKRLLHGRARRALWPGE